jgi:hypothetical protein
MKMEVRRNGRMPWERLKALIKTAKASPDVVHEELSGTGYIGYILDRIMSGEKQC